MIHKKNRAENTARVDGNRFEYIIFPSLKNVNNIVVVIVIPGLVYYFIAYSSPTVNANK